MRELKLKVGNSEKMERHLLRIGAKFVKELSVIDTYFIQSGGDVLKIKENDEGAFLVKLRSLNDGFEIVSYEPVPDVRGLCLKLKKKFGLKCVLKKRQRFFVLKNYELSINLIEGVGIFLVITGSSLSRNDVVEKLKIENPIFVSVPFCDVNNFI